MTRRARPGRISSLRRIVRYKFVIPVIRSPHAPEYTARGVAIGVFWALTPLVGLQTVLMIGTWRVLSRTFRKEASLVQALVWSWINNPATMIPLYYAFYATGLWMLGSQGSSGEYDAFAGLWNQAAHEPTLARRASFVAREFGSALLIGCLPYAVVATAVAYKWAISIASMRRRRIRGDRTPDPLRA